MPSASATLCCRLEAAFALVTLLAATASAQVSVVAQQVDGSSVSGQLVQLTAKQAFLRIRDNVEPTGGTNILRLLVSPETVGDASEKDSRATPETSATPWLLTSTGDWLRVRPLMIDDESIVARWSHLANQPPLTIPLEVCRGALFELSSDPYRQGIEFLSLFDNDRSSDRLVLQNGDRITGEFAGLDDGKLQIETLLGMTTVSPENVHSIAFNPELISTPALPVAHVRVLLRDGSLLRLKTALSNGGVLLGETLADASISLPLEHIAEVWFFDDNRVPVSSLPLTNAELTPYLSVRREPQLDRNILGGPLRVRGIPAASGIGTTSGLTITFALDARFQTLLGRVALDDAAGAAGSVAFEIVADGRRLWSSGVVTVESGPVKLPRLDVSQISQLALKVDFADRGSVRDIANWCDLVLLK